VKQVIKVKRLYLMLVIILAVFFVLAIVTPAAAQAASSKEAALEELREAIRAIPAYDKITEADRPAVEKAQAMAEKGMRDYGITEYDICVLSAKLGAAVGKLGVKIALPSTGGLSVFVPLGLLSLLSGVAIIAPRKRKQ
jgi:LPXTG-motif cell wall-anchored protein